MNNPNPENVCYIQYTTCYASFEVTVKDLAGSNVVFKIYRIDVKVLSNSASEFLHDYWDMNSGKTHKNQIKIVEGCLSRWNFGG